jgi:glycosyltransferase involved in cell wall biosynthesis
MRLLVITQKVNPEDSVLGFFRRWIDQLSLQATTVHVICLEEGKYVPPNNVSVYSLGKEQGASKLEYIVHFFQHLFTVRGQYDAVFIHMNQEYALLGGLYWKLARIPVYLWRNHPNGNMLTTLASLLVTKTLSTSTDSYTARYDKNIVMPAGIDTQLFRPVSGVLRNKNSVCMIGRIAPIKNIDICLQAVKLLIDSGTQVSLTIVGSPLKKDTHYYNSLKMYVVNNKLESYVRFVDAVPPHKLPEIYSAHEICLNLTPTGSFDKTIVESASCGAVPLVINTSLERFLPALCMTELDPEIIARSIQKALSPDVRLKAQQELTVFAGSQSLQNLVSKLMTLFTHVQE